MIGCDRCNKSTNTQWRIRDNGNANGKLIMCKALIVIGTKATQHLTKEAAQHSAKDHFRCAVYTYRDSNLFVNSTIWGRSIRHSAYDWHSTACFHLVLLISPIDFCNQLTSFLRSSMYFYLFVLECWQIHYWKGL